MRVAAYVRVSTDEQADKGNSLAEQQERLGAYCVAMGWDAPTFIVDDGYSAKDLRRPGIQKLLQRVQNGDFDIVLTSKLDRLCRKLLELLQLVDLFDNHSCSYVSASESFDTSTAVGRMTLQLLGAFAEFERERISERVKDNMISLARNTDRALTLPCYGYDVIDGKYHINEDEAQHIRYMFELAEQGHGHRKIAQLLNLRGSTTKRGKTWDQVNVKRLMQTETISGIQIYNKRKSAKGKLVMRPESEWIVSEDNHPAIITPDRFRTVQEIFRSRSRSRKHADSETYLLTGLIRCGHCGGTMKGQTSRNKNNGRTYTYYRYICASYVNGYGCQYHAAHRDDLESFVVGLLAEFAAKGEALNVKVSAPLKDENTISEIKAELAKVDRRMQKQIEAYENELISAADLKQARERVERERNDLQVQLTKMEQQNVDKQAVRKKISVNMDEIRSADRLVAKNVIRQLIESVEVKDQMVGIVINGN